MLAQSYAEVLCQGKEELVICIEYVCRHMPAQSYTEVLCQGKEELVTCIQHVCRHSQHSVLLKDGTVQGREQLVACFTCQQTQALYAGLFFHCLFFSKSNFGLCKFLPEHIYIAVIVNFTLGAKCKRGTNISLYKVV